ncbi:protein-L-isoaspartate O-methyltransferase [Streptomyces sp. NPDC048638]|uniref:protein-L-isoaspartate O-methyltransferase n=1 Tax=Streptomyces sp. NPDC048638 TaxID=3365580 RepID=UPI003711EA33
MTTDVTTPGTDRTEQSPDATAARAAMVARLDTAGAIQPGPVRDALLALAREALMPQAYVRRSQDDEKPPRWDLLDWTQPGHRPELINLLYSGNSVSIQHDGEPITGRTPSSRTGGAMTSMSSTLAVTVDLLQELQLAPGQRVLDIGTGAAVTAAVACWICGDGGVVTLDRDAHVTRAAATHLADIGLRPAAVTGEGDDGCAERAPYDRLLATYAVPWIPPAWVDQLAPGGRALANLTAASPSWPGLAVIAKTRSGRVEAELRAVEFGHRLSHNFTRIFLSREFQNRIAAGEGAHAFRSRHAPPADADRAFWLALINLRGGLVRDWSADHLRIGAPACGSWLTARLDEDAGDWAVTVHGPRDIWDEIQRVATLWRAAGSPSGYRLHLDPDSREQWVTGGTGATHLSWPLGHPAEPTPPPRPGTPQRTAAPPHKDRS